MSPESERLNANAEYIDAENWGRSKKNRPMVALIKSLDNQPVYIGSSLRTLVIFINELLASKAIKYNTAHTRIQNRSIYANDDVLIVPDTRSCGCEPLPDWTSYREFHYATKLTKGCDVYVVHPYLSAEDHFISIPEALKNHPEFGPEKRVVHWMSKHDVLLSGECGSGILMLREDSALERQLFLRRLTKATMWAIPTLQPGGNTRLISTWDIVMKNVVPHHRHTALVAILDRGWYYSRLSKTLYLNPSVVNALHHQHLPTIYKPFLGDDYHYGSIIG